jgi:hypothetical protein
MCGQTSLEKTENRTHEYEVEQIVAALQQPYPNGVASKEPVSKCGKYHSDTGDGTNGDTLSQRGVTGNDVA